MHKKYWSGTTRIISDISWCLLIVSAMTFIKQGSLIANIPSQLWTIIELFFTFFFWSWNKEHLKNRIAKYSIHFLFVFYLIGILCIVGLCTAYPALLLSYMIWCPLILIGIQTFFVLRKYKRLCFI